MDTVIVFCFVVLVQLSEVKSQILDSQHGDHKGLIRKNLFQDPVAKSLYVNPALFFRDSAIKKSFKNYAPNINEPQIHQKHNERNLPHEKSSADNHGDQILFSRHIEENYENPNLQKLLKNERDSKKDLLGHELKDLVSANQQSNGFLLGKQLSQTPIQTFSDQPSNYKLRNQEFSDITQSKENSLIKTQIDSVNKESSLTINALNTQQETYQQVSLNKEDVQNFTERQSQQVSSHEQSNQSSESSTKKINEELQKQMSASSQQSPQESFISQQSQTQQGWNTQNSRQINDKEHTTDYRSKSSVTNDNLSLSNTTNWDAEKQFEQESVIVDNIKAAENSTRNNFVSNKTDSQSEYLYDLEEENEFWRNEDTYIDDDSTDPEETINLTTSQGELAMQTNEADKQIESDVGQISPQDDKINSNKIVPPRRGPHIALQPEQNSSLTKMDQDQTNVRPSQNQSSSVSVQNQFKQDQTPLQTSDDPPLLSNQEDPPTLPDEDQPEFSSNPPFSEAEVNKPSAATKQNQFKQQHESKRLGSRPKHTQFITLIKQSETNGDSHIWIDNRKTNTKSNEINTVQQDEDQLLQDKPDQGRSTTQSNKDETTPKFDQYQTLPRPTKYQFSQPDQTEPVLKPELGQQPRHGQPKFQSGQDHSIQESVKPQQQKETEKSLHQPIQNKLLVHTGHDKLLPDPEQDKFLPNPGQDQPLPYPGQDQPLLDPGQDMPLLDSGREKILPDPGQDKLLPNSGQDQPLQNSGDDKPLLDPGQDKPLPQLVQYVSPTILHKSQIKIFSKEDPHPDQNQINMSKRPQTASDYQYNKTSEDQSHHIRASPNTYHESDRTEHEQREITSSMHNQESTEQLYHELTRNENETKEQVQYVPKSLSSRTIQQIYITKNSSKNLQYDKSTVQSDEDKSTGKPKQDNNTNNPNQLNTLTSLDQDKLVTTSDQDHGGKNKTASKSGPDEIIKLAPKSMTSIQDQKDPLPKADENKTTQINPQKDKPQPSEHVQKINQDKKLTDQPTATTKYEQFKTLSIDKSSTIFDNDKERINKPKRDGHTTKPHENKSVIKSEQSETTSSTNQFSKQQPITTSDLSTLATKTGEKKSPSTTHPEKLTSEPKQDNPDHEPIDRKKPATIPDQGKPKLESTQNKPPKQQDQDLTTKPTTESSVEPMTKPVQEPKSAVIPDQKKPKSESPNNPSETSHQHVVKTNTVKTNKAETTAIPVQASKPAIVHNQAQPTRSTENLPSRELKQDVPVTKSRTNPGQVIAMKKPRTEPRLAVPDVNRPATNYFQDRPDQLITKTNVNKPEPNEEQPIITRKQPNSKKLHSTNNNDMQQSQYSEHSQETRSSSTWTEGDDIYSQRRGRYDLPLSSSSHDAQQAIETDINYKTLIVSDGSQNGRCYCTCDINSKPVFISLDRLRGWPTL